MFSSLILDVGIGLVFVYFILSLLCSVIVETIASFCKLRPKTLLQGIKLLIFPPEDSKSLFKTPKKALTPAEQQKEEEKKEEEKKIRSANEKFLKALYSSPLFLGQTPSYISSRSFVLALLETVKNYPEVKEKLPQVPLKGVDNIKQLVTALPKECSIGATLLPLLELAGDELDKAMEMMEKWYDEAMDRVSGWYKRNSQIIALIVALLVAFAVNADTFQIAKTLYSDQSVRAAVVSSAQELVKTKASAPAAATPQPKKAPPATLPGAAILPPATGGTTTPPAITPPQPGVGGTAASSGGQKNETLPPIKEKKDVSPPTDLQAQVKQIEQAFKLGIPLGWSDFCTFKEGIRHPIKWLGILFTAIMAVMGSNFWFDLLNQLINVRGSGKKPPSTEAAANK
jgi:hypothetical protein